MSEILVTDWTDPGTVNTTYNGSSYHWTLLSNVLAEDGTGTGLLQVEVYDLTDTIEVTNFGFSFPGDPTWIWGVEARVKAYKTGNTVNDDDVKLIVGGSVTGDAKDVPTAVNDSTYDWITYGGQTDQWGLSLTSAQVEASDFGFKVQFVQAATPGPWYVRVDSMQMRIYYRAAGNLILTL